MKKLALGLVTLSMAVQAGVLRYSPKSIGNFGLRGTRQLVLTFDDGPNGKPSSGATKSVLDSLKLYKDAGFKTQGTFFVNGQKFPGRKALLDREKSEGHIIADHTFSHPNLTYSRWNNSTTLLNAFKDHHNLIEQYLPSSDNLDKKWYFRAPFGAWRSKHASVLNADPILRNYVGPIFWSIGGVLDIGNNGVPTRSADWDCWRKKVSPKLCAIGYLKQTNQLKGGVVLFHDVNIKSAEMFKYLLVTWTGTNLFEDTKYESLVSKYYTGKYEFISMDDVKALDAYDSRLK